MMYCTVGILDSNGIELMNEFNSIHMVIIGRVLAVIFFVDLNIMLALCKVLFMSNHLRKEKESQVQNDVQQTL